MHRLLVDSLETLPVHLTNRTIYCTLLTAYADLQQDAVPIVNNRFGGGVGPIFLNHLNCEGDESGILSCKSPVKLHTCTHGDDVGVLCPG